MSDKLDVINMCDVSIVYYFISLSQGEGSDRKMHYWNGGNKDYYFKPKGDLFQDYRSSLMHEQL